MTTTPPDLPLDSRSFRNTMGLFATGVTVLATAHQDDVRAMTANSITSVSIDPMLILVCVKKTAQIAAILQKTTGFSINILSQSQQDLSNFFARFWPEHTLPPSFSFIPWQPHAPYLADSLAALACRTHQFMDGGDHWIIIGEVIALNQNDSPLKPLLYYRGQYRQLEN